MSARVIRRLALLLAAACVVAGVALAAPGGPERRGTVRTAAAAPPAAPRSVPILLYHHLSPVPAGTRHPTLYVPRATLRRQLGALAGDGYRAVTLAQVWRSWHGGAALPRKPVVLSFDDGYDSQATVAAPALRARGWPGVLFLWTDRLGVPGGLGRAQVRTLIAAGWEIDAHTETHPDLTTVPDDRLEREVAGSRAAIRDAFGVDAAFFAYPYGRSDARVRAAVEAAGFDAATTIQRGLASPAADPFALRRIIVSGRESPAALLGLLRRSRSG